MLEWVWVKNPWWYPRWVIRERRGNTKRIIEVEQAILIYSNAQNKNKKRKEKEKKRENKKREKKKKQGEQEKKRKRKEKKKWVRVIVWTLWRYPRWVMRERRGILKENHTKSCSIYSNALKRVWVSKGPFQRYPRWVIWERRGNTRIRKKAHQKLKDCFDTQNSICLCSMLTSFV